MGIKDCFRRGESPPQTIIRVISVLEFEEYQKAGRKTGVQVKKVDIPGEPVRTEQSIPQGRRRPTGVGEVVSVAGEVTIEMTPTKGTNWKRSGFGRALTEIQNRNEMRRKGNS